MCLFVCLCLCLCLCAYTLVYVSGLIKDRIDVFEAVVAGKMGMRVCI